MAYVLGFFAADGGMIHNERGAYYLEFNSTDKSLISSTRSLLGSSHAISKRVRRKDRWKQVYRLQIGSKEMFEDLLQLGMTLAKSKTLAFPKVPRKYLTDFIRGYFDGDGTVYFREHYAKDRGKKRWVFQSRFTSGSAGFLKVLHKNLAGYGVKGGFIYKKERGYELVFSHRDSIALYKLMYNNAPACASPHADRHAGLFLPRKKKTFEKAIRTLYGDVA